jgi:hypothetical protein
VVVVLFPAILTYESGPTQSVPAAQDKTVVTS